MEGIHPDTKEPTVADTRIILAVNNNQGYSADQVERTLTINDLINALQSAADKYGEDALVITKDTGNQYGANFGGIDTWEDLITVVQQSHEERYDQLVAEGREAEADAFADEHEDCTDDESSCEWEGR